MSRPIIALLTDFGLRDYYAAAMKGVMLGICPEATLVDISHEVPAHDVLAGALELAAVYRFFPVGTIFLAIVDPGVGSARRGLAATIGPYRFVAPDNGVLSLVLDETPASAVVELTSARYARADVSRTFEGRDRFAPAAAWMAAGVELSALGTPADAPSRLPYPRPSLAADGIHGVVVRIDRFGNLVTNIERGAIEQLAADGALTVRVGGVEVSRLVDTYADVSPGELCALIGGSNHLEIAANRMSAAAALDADRGATVHVTARA